MKKKIIWMLVSCLMVLSLVIASCGQKEGEQTSSDIPQYGGTLTLSLIGDPNWDLISFGATWPQEQDHQRMFDGNWAKGPAGGYGEGLTTWGMSTRIPEFDTGYLATDYYWEVSPDGTEVTTYFTIRNGVHFAPVDSEAGRLVDGREMTVDDCVWSWNIPIKDENAQNWQLYPNVRYPTAVKTGPNSFKITHKYEDHIDAIMRENLCCRVMPPELWDAYNGYDSCTNWEYSVGTGPFMITDFVPGNLVMMEKNPNYWMTNPIGSGKGNQLPYIDTFKYIIVPDISTQQAALRTGQLDMMGGFTTEDKDVMLTTASKLMVAQRGKWRVVPIFMKTDQAPYNDVRVRRAMVMATNFNEINQSLYQGLGDIISWPYFQLEGYEPLYVSVDDPDCTDLVKELYSYNPDKAKQLLNEAGYPNGFKAVLTLTQDAVDYYSIVKDMWDQVDIDLELDVAADFGALIGRAFSITYELIAIGTSPDSSYPEQSLYAVRNWVNASLINEPYVDETAKAVKSLAITDFHASMELCRPLCIYLIEQAYCVPAPFYPTYSMWWPWLKNYSGEVSVGYWGTDHWSQFIWIDQALKTSMGY